MPGPNRSNDRIKVWTLQPVVVWDRLQQQGILTVDPQLSETKRQWPECVDWMMEQMSLRLPVFDNHLPWWGWTKPEPSLRFWRRYLRDETGFHCKIELSVPRAEVLQSMAIPWDLVLGNMLVPKELPTDPPERIDEIFASGVAPSQAEIDASRQRVFLIDEPGFSRNWSRYIQCTFEYLRLENVQKATIFRVDRFADLSDKKEAGPSLAPPQ